MACEIKFPNCTQVFCLQTLCCLWIKPERCLVLLRHWSGAIVVSRYNALPKTAISSDNKFSHFNTIRCPRTVYRGGIKEMRQLAAMRGIGTNDHKLSPIFKLMSGLNEEGKKRGFRRKSQQRVPLHVILH